MTVLFRLFFLIVNSTAFGSHFGIQTYEGKYISPQNNYDFQQSWILGPWEQFSFVDQERNETSEDIGYLYSHKGVYIGVQEDRVFQTTSAGPWERFEKVNLPGGNTGFRSIAFNRYLSIGNGGKLGTSGNINDREVFRISTNFAKIKVSGGFNSYFGLYTYEDRYISPQEDGNLTQVLKFDPWEQFTFVDEYGYPTRSHEGYLYSHKGVYIGVQDHRVFQAAEAGPWERFERIRLPDGKVGFRNIAFNRYLSFKDGGLQTASHLKHWEAFWQDWRYQKRKASTSVFLIEGRIPNTPAKHGGLFFVNDYPESLGVNKIQNHFMAKNYFFGGDGVISAKMNLEGRRDKFLGQIDLTIWEAQEWVKEWVKTKKYRLTTFNCWKLPQAFAKSFGLDTSKTEEPEQNLVLRSLGIGFTLPVYPLLTETKKI